MRWGALFFEQTFEPLEEDVSDAGEWRLTRYVIPEGVDTGNELPIGYLERTRGAGHRRDLTLERSRLGGLRLRVEYHEFLLMAAEKEALRLDLRALRHRTRRASGDDAELKKLRDRASLIDQRLRGLEERLRSLEPSKTHVVVDGEKVEGGSAAAEVTARLLQDGEHPVIQVSDSSGEYRFVLDP